MWAKKGARSSRRKVKTEKRDRSGNSGEGPHFEVTGQHVIIFVALVFAAAWAAGLLPDP